MQFSSHGKWVGNFQLMSLSGHIKSYDEDLEGGCWGR